MRIPRYCHVCASYGWHSSRIFFIEMRLEVRLAHAAIVEFNAHIGNIGGICHDSHATGGDQFYFAFYYTEDDIYIMYHEVEYHSLRYRGD